MGVKPPLNEVSLYQGEHFKNKFVSIITQEIRLRG